MLLSHLPSQMLASPARHAAGVGDEHAKWSPVATTWYRLMPEVVLLQQPRGQVRSRYDHQRPALPAIARLGCWLRRAAPLAAPACDVQASEPS